MRISWAFLLLLLVIFPACEEDKDPLRPEPTLSLSLALPDTVLAGQAFTLNLGVVDDAGDAVSWSGVIQLSLDSGNVSPADVALDGESARPTLIITGVEGTVTLHAQAGELVAEAGPFFVDAVRMAGNPDDPARAAIPAVLFVPAGEDYICGYPGLGDLPVSTTTFVLLLSEEATVAQINALLAILEADIVGGIPGAGVLFLRLFEGGHGRVESAVEMARASEAVDVATLDVVLSNTLQPRPNGGQPLDWDWQQIPEGGNWGLERIRMPQAWNLKPALDKLGTANVVTGILDSQFDTGHTDLDYASSLVLGANGAHGTHVGGTIAATWNDTGIDGLNPFAALSLAIPPFTNAPTILGTTTSWGQTWLSWLDQMMLLEPEMRALNISQGYNWGVFGINSDANLTAQALASGQGQILHQLIEYHAALGPVPLIFTSAGNDSDDGFGEMQAFYASAMCNAALEHGNGHIMVVEAVYDTPGSSPGECARADFSNPGGHLSAPGVGILSTTTGSDYDTLSGTSQAAPFLTGLAGYLLAVDGQLSHAELRELLTANSLPVSGNAAQRIDAFASVIDIDRIRQNQRVLRLLADIDDGSEDGNSRVLEDGTVVTDEDLDQDGGVGDGQINMADFRRWRDWLLQVEDEPGLALDGGLTHPKKDPNGNGSVESASVENVYPRGDFNGDGFLDRKNERYLPGAIQAPATDLAVLQHLFEDPDYDAGQLPGLLESFDLWITPAAFFADPGLSQVRITVRGQDSGTLYEERLLAGMTQAGFTLPVGEEALELRAEGEDAGGTVFSFAEDLFLPTLGADEYWTPEASGTQLALEADAPESLQPGESFVLTIRAGYLNSLGQPDWEPGIDVSLGITGGWAAQTTGITDAQGEFQTLVTFESEEPDPVLTIFVTASDANGHETVLPLQLAPDWPLLLQENLSRVYIAAVANDGLGTDCAEFTNLEVEPDDYSPIDEEHTHDCDTASEWGSGNSVATGSMTATFQTTEIQQDLSLQGLTMQGLFNCSSDGSGGMTNYANAYCWVKLRFRLEHSLQIRIHGTSSFSTTLPPSWNLIYFSLRGLDSGVWHLQYENRGEDEELLDTTLTLPSGEYLLDAGSHLGSSFNEGDSPSATSGAFEWQMDVNP